MRTYVSRPYFRGAHMQSPRRSSRATSASLGGCGRQVRMRVCVRISVLVCACVCAGRSVPGPASIRLTGRVRPAGRDEGACPVHVDGDTNQLVVEHNSVRAAFNFDRCFGQDSSQEHVFDEVRARARARALRSCARACGYACLETSLIACGRVCRARSGV